MPSYQLQADPKRQLFGVASVILFHVIVVYALVSGLAKRVVDVVRAPIETRIIEEIKEVPPPPPPPPEVKVPPRKRDIPPPFVPPPEVTIAEPPPPAIVATTPTPPPKAEIVPTPPPPPVVAEPAPAPKPAVVTVAAACPKRASPVTPPRAERDGITGSVQASLTIKGGKVTNVEILKSTPRGVFDDAVRKAVLQYGCQDNGDQEVVATQVFEFASAN